MSDAKSILQKLQEFLVQDDHDGFTNAISSFDKIDMVDNVQFYFLMFFSIFWCSLHIFNSTLHLCALRCNYRFLLATLSKHPDVNLQNNEGSTALEIAISTGCIHLAASILQAGANPNIANKKNLYPLDIALQKNDTRSLQLLLNFGADPNIHQTKTPILCTAIENNYIDAIKILIHHGANVDFPENPPVVCAVKNQNLQALELLLRANADFNLQIENQSLLQYATKKKLSVLPFLQKLNLK